MEDTVNASLVGQLALFSDIVPARAPRRRWPPEAALAVLPPEQLVMELRPPEPVWVDPDDVPEPGDFPEHIVVSAAGLEMPKTRAAASIFELGARQAAADILSEFTLNPSRWAEPSTDRQPQRHARIVREGDVTRYIAMREQETPEWQEKETARRARQVLPKPPKQTFRLRKKEAV